MSSSYMRYFAAEQARSTKTKRSLKELVIRVVVFLLCLISLGAGLYQIFLTPKPAHAQSLGPLYEVPYWQEGQSEEPPHWTLLSATGFGRVGLEDVETRYGLWAWHDTQTGDLIIQGYEQKIIWTSPVPLVTKTPLEQHRFANHKLVDASVFIQILPDQTSHQILFSMGAEWFRATTAAPMQVFPHLSERPRTQVSINNAAEFTIG